MSGPNPNAQTDHNLLLGILAYQTNFITRDALFAGMQAWLYDKSKSLAEILQNQGALDADRRTLLEALVRQHLKQNGDDPQKSLQAVSSISSLRAELEQLPDPGLQASIAHLSNACQGDDLSITRTFLAGESTSHGTRFRILRPHAKGGLGQVSIALDSELNREVALKEIQSRYADNPESRSRFLLEAEITGGLEHPGIVPVYGLGTYADGRPFYAMRFIKGDSLMDAIDKFHGRSRAPTGEGPPFDSLEFKQLLRRLIDVCDAMQYAHDRGVLHRDLKPGNIMLGKYGETLVVDWGLARARGKFNEPQASATGVDEPTLKPASASGSAETVAGSAMGTPAYMSPEQAEGRLDLLGSASDVYSLGATLYCLLTGQPSITDKEVAEVLRKVQQGEFKSPRQIQPAIAPALEAICLKAMALRPANRYASPRELTEDIEHWLADEPIRAWPEPWTVKTRRWVGHHRTLVTGAAVAVLVILVCMIWISFLLGETNKQLADERDNARKQQGLANEARVNSDKERKKAELLTKAEKNAREEAALGLITSTFYFQKLTDDLIKSDASVSPLDGSLTGTLNDMRQGLNDNEVALIWIPGSEASFVVLLEGPKVSGQGISLYRLPPSDTIAELVMALTDRETLLLPARAHFLCREGFDVLLKNLQESIKGKDLVIVPHGSFCSLPFGILAYPRDNEDKSFFLVEKHGIRYLPSLIALHRIRVSKQSDTPDWSLWCIGDCVYYEGADKMRMATNSFRRLVATGQELAGITSLFEKGTMKALRGTYASKSAVKKASHGGELTRFRFLHFATHAILGDGVRRRPALVLSSTRLGDDDIFLDFDEISKLNISADLVILSASHTGSGLLDQQGYRSLARAFLYAGSRGVICTLDSIDDEAALRLMTAMYRYLKAGHSSTEALRRAQVEMIRAGEAPFFWGPFIMIGI